MTGLAAFMASRGGFLMVFSEITGIMLRPASLSVTGGGRILAGSAFAGAAMACLTAFPACLGSSFAIVCEIAGTMLAANVTGASCLFTILGKVPRIAPLPFFSHCFPLFACIETLSGEP